MSQTSDRLEAVRLYVDATVNAGDDTGAALRPVLADDVTVAAPLGAVNGAQAVLDSFKNPMLGPLFATATWSDPVEDGDAVTITATMPPGTMIGGIEYEITFGGATITSISQRFLPAAKPPAADLDLSGAIAEAIAGAPSIGAPMIAAYIDEGGHARLSYRGTVQVLTDDQVALWARDPQSGMAKAVASNPNVTLWYSDMKSRTLYQLFGRGYVATDQATNDRVYDGSPENERNLDADRRGTAIVVDVDRVEGRANGALINMARSAEA